MTPRARAAAHSRRLRWLVPALGVTLLFAATVMLGVLGQARLAYGLPRLTPAQVRANLIAAARHYDLSAAKTRWIVAKGVHVAWGESRFHTRTGHRNGCFGLYQFNTSWRHPRPWSPGHRHADPRGCGRCSCWRFVSAYVHGGKRAIYRHWAATIR